MKFLIYILLLDVLLCGCTSSYLVTEKGEDGSLSYVDFNGEMKGETFSIELSNGTEREGEDVSIINEDAEWKELGIETTVHIKVDSLKTVIKKNHLQGGLEGFGFGTLGGLVLLGAIFLIDPGREFSNVNELLTTPKLLVLPALGTLLGIIIGHMYEYEFQNNQQQEKSNK